MSFEESIEKLSKVVYELESGNLNLEDSIKKFEEGMSLSKKCNDILEDAEKRITILIKKDEKLEEEDFLEWECFLHKNHFFVNNSKRWFLLC